MTQWNIRVSERTDRAVRNYLDRSGQTGDGLSQFVNDAVRQRLFDLTVNEVKERNAQYNQQEILDLIDEEVDAARASRP